jgi:hypothetical protein
LVLMAVQMSAASSTAAGLARTSASARPPAQVRRTEQRVEEKVAEARVEEQIVGRVERLVDRMEAVASRISAEGTSTPRRAVLVARYNDLQRQVNELDGIVAPEGQESAAQKQVGSAAPARPVRSRRSRTPSRAEPTRAARSEAAVSVPGSGSTARRAAAAPRKMASAAKPAQTGRLDVLA